MKILTSNLKNANITIVANKLYTSFLTANLFDKILPNPNNVVQVAPFGMLDYGTSNFIVDVDNRRVVINHNSGNLVDSPIPKMAQKFIDEIKGPEIVAVGFNYVIEIVCDSSFGEYSLNFLKEEIKQQLEGISGIGFKIFKKSSFNSILMIEPSVMDTEHAFVTGNFHYEFPQLINWESDLLLRYKDLEACRF